MSEQPALTEEEAKKLAEEGLELRRLIEERVREMKRIYPERRVIGGPNCLCHRGRK